MYHHFIYNFLADIMQNIDNNYFRYNQTLRIEF